jgi:hypothetical protein
LEFTRPESNRDHLELDEEQAEEPGHLLCAKVEGGYLEDVDPGSQPGKKNTLKTLNNSMPRRMEAVIKARGDMTKY